MKLLWEISIAEFSLVTVVLGGGAAYMAGRAVARGWQSWLRLVAYVFLLAVAARFIHFSLFHGTFFIPLSGFGTALHYFIVDFVVLAVMAWLGRQRTRALQMATQYAFLYRPAGPLGWRARSQPPLSDAR